MAQAATFVVPERVGAPPESLPTNLETIGSPAALRPSRRSRSPSSELGMKVGAERRALLCTCSTFPRQVDS